MVNHGRSGCKRCVVFAVKKGWKAAIHMRNDDIIDKKQHWACIP